MEPIYGFTNVTIVSHSPKAVLRRQAFEKQVIPMLYIYIILHSTTLSHYIIQLVAGSKGYAELLSITIEFNVLLWMSMPFVTVLS